MAKKKKKPVFPGLGLLKTWGFERIEWDVMIRALSLSFSDEEIDGLDDTETLSVFDDLGLRFNDDYDMPALRRLLKRLMLNKFEVLEMDVNIMNETELVEILRLLGLRVDRGYGLQELRGILRHLGHGKSVNVSASADFLRDRLIGIWKKHEAKIRDQLPPVCEFKCYGHPDLLVVDCYIKNIRQIKKEFG